MKATVKLKDTFSEGSLVMSKDGERVYIVTVTAKGYDEDQEGTFWAIPLNFGAATCGGNYRKDLFTKFSGSITLEQ